MFHSKRGGRASRRRPVNVPNLGAEPAREPGGPDQVDLDQYRHASPGARRLRRPGGRQHPRRRRRLVRRRRRRRQRRRLRRLRRRRPDGHRQRHPVDAGHRQQQPRLPGLRLAAGQRLAATVVANFLNLTANQRVGDLGTLGNNTQTNPTNPTAATDGFAVQRPDLLHQPQPQLPARRLGDRPRRRQRRRLRRLHDRRPGGINATGTNQGTGRAYIVYGGPALSNSISKTVDLDSPSTDLTPVVTLFSDTLTAGSNLGSSGAAGDLIVDNFRDVAVGAPNADPLGANGAAARPMPARSTSSPAPSSPPSRPPPRSTSTPSARAAASPASSSPATRATRPASRSPWSATSASRPSSAKSPAIRSSITRPGKMSPAPHCGKPATTRNRHLRYLCRFKLVFRALLLGQQRKESRSKDRRPIIGCRSINMSAGSNMRFCICSIRVFSPAR